MSGHIITDFKDLRKIIGEITKDKPAKTQYQQQAEKMGYRPEAEAQPKDDKGDSGIARTLGKKHAGEDDIKKAYIKLGRSAQGSVQYQRKLLQKQLAKMGFKTYSMYAFDQLFKFEQKDFDKFISIMEGKGFDDKQLDGLKKSYGNLKKVNPTSPVGKNLLGMFKKMSKDELQSLASAGINFLSLLAVSNLIRMGVKPADIKYVKAEGTKKKKWKEPLKGFPGNEEIDESKMGDLLLDIQQGATAKELAKLHNISIQVAKNFLSDYYGRKKSTKAPGLKNEVAGFKAPFGRITQADKDDAVDFLQSIKKNDPNAYKKLIKRLKLKDGVIPGLKEGKYAKYSDLLLGKSRAIDKYGPDSVVVKAINKDIEKEMKRLGIKEGTMTVPFNKGQQKALNKILQRPLKAKDAQQAIQNYVDDDELADKIGAMPGNKDAREVIIKWLSTYGPSKTKSWASLVGVGESREDRLKEQKEHAEQSPFKLKSEQYPRAVAINNDGFGKRHATVEDIISACDSFGMILDKELQVEQIQKQLGKVGFISYKKSELEDVFHERETQRVILALESVTEEQEPISYCQGEIAYAQLHEREIEFLKPDGQKAVGPVLKMSGNTYNVKDKFTGKSYTYKYTGETQVKSFKEVVNEGKFPKQLIKQAGGIAFDKRYYQGNMSGAIAAIEKLKKGLSSDPKVKEMLKIANESVSELDQRKYNKVQEWEDAIEASGDKEAYQKFFNKAMKKFGVSSPDELEGDKKKEFFDYVDKNWKGDHEEVEQDVHKSYRVDGRRKNFREKMKKLGYIKRY